MADALWILVANASRARLFATDAKAEDWTLLAEMQHEESRSRSGFLLNQPDNPNAGSLHKPQPENQPDARQELEEERFAREVAARIERGYEDHAFGRLVVAAPPGFLGALRKHFSKRVLDVLLTDVNKDYTSLPERELVERIPL